MYSKDVHLMMSIQIIGIEGMTISPLKAIGMGVSPLIFLLLLNKFEYNNGRIRNTNNGSFHATNACRYALVVGLIENRLPICDSKWSV